jgi:hypothetical protein
MRNGRSVAAVIVMLLGARAWGQSLPPIDPAVTPAAVQSETVILADGTAVSKPLTETPLKDEQPAQPPPPTVTETGPGGPDLPFGKAWQSYEFLLWWTKAHPLPPLATMTRTGAPPVLGGPNTNLLAGGMALDNPEAGGGRFLIGYSLNNSQTVGMEWTYLFLGTRTAEFQTSTTGAANSPTIGRPFVDALTAAESVSIVGGPGVARGLLDITTVDRVQGWEINAVGNLFAGTRLRIDGLVGYRYFMVHEGLRINQLSLPSARTSPFDPSLIGVADQFDAHNRFHGGQFGLRADFHKGPVFFQLTAKAALGQNYEVVKVSGTTISVVPGAVPQVLSGGLLGQATNTGRFVRQTYAVLPEGTAKVGFCFTDQSRFYVGYNFIYLSDAVRPGDQVDRMVNPLLIPTNGALAFGGPERPRTSLTRTDFWVQGLVIGLEYHY